LAYQIYHLGIHRPDPGWKDEEALKFSHRDLNTLIHFHQAQTLSDSSRLARQADNKNQNFASIEEDPQSHLRRQQDVWDVRHEPQYVPLLNHLMMVTTTKVVTIEEVEEEAILLTPLTPRILQDLPVQILPELHVGSFGLHLIHHLLEQLIKKEEIDPMPSQRNPSSRIFNYSLYCSFPRTTISIQTTPTKYYLHLVFVRRAHPRSLQNWPSFSR
jgi:hypothetical protein